MMRCQLVFLHDVLQFRMNRRLVAGCFISILLTVCFELYCSVHHPNRRSLLSADRTLLHPD